MCFRVKHYVIIFIMVLTMITPCPASVPAPDFSLKGKGEKVYRLADFKGRYLILYFFSYTCPHCEKTTPVINELYKKSSGTYEILGVVYRASETDEMGTAAVFPVARGTKKIREDYKVSGTPYFLIIDSQAMLKERFVGEKGTEVLEHAVRTGDLTKTTGLMELSSDPRAYEGKTIETGGRLIQTSPAYFPKPVFMLTNGADRIRVSPWLPLETAPLPRGIKKERKKTMSDMLDKYVKVSGKVIVQNGSPVIEVKDAKIAE